MTWITLTSRVPAYCKHFDRFTRSIVKAYSSQVSPLGYHRGYFARGLHLTSCTFHGEYEWQDPKSEDEVVNVNFIRRDNSLTKIRGKVGDNILYLAKRYDVEVEGACEASLACTTCHVYIVDGKYWDKFPPATETEEDLLDAAPFLKDNSRLGCQLVLCKEHDGLTLKLPQATRNFYVDGHKPTPH